MSGAGGGAGGAGGTGGAGALGGLGGSLEDKDCELLCPVCFELIDEAYVTRCGHSFCYACIAKSVEQHRRCPKCGAAVATREHMFPNFMLNELVARRRLRAARPPAPPDGGGDRLRSLLAAESRHLAMPDVELMLEVLTRRKRLLEAESAAAHQRLLYEFLAQLHRHRTQQLAQLAREAALVQADMQTVAGALTELRAGAAGLATFPEDAPAGATADAVHALRKELTELAGSVSDSAAPAPDDEGFAGGSGGGWDALANRWRRLVAHFEDFVQCYFAHRADDLYFPAATPARPRRAGPQDDHVPDNEPSTTTKPPCNGDQRLPEGAGVEPPPAPPGPPPGGGAGGAGGLDAFREDLVSFTRYRALRPLATLSYSSDAINYSTIVSTIEFDKDEEFFAIAGVTKRIKVFEYEAVVRDAVDVHYPCAEMQCAHKISCVSWNAYHKNVLASADYEGTVAVWDAGTGQRTRALLEHDKRCWSVHFNRADVRLLASGSDDARVKLWALNADRSVATLEARFNVCCVRFNPRSSCHLAFGSADHCVHYYDLRAPRQPLAVFRDHRKAVSYVKFLDARTLVSASTDSALKMWRVESPRCVRSFTGHANEKNFVGLATEASGRYVACGSENNALYVYYAGLSKPLLAHRFDAVRGFLERGTGGERREDEPSEFVSAVCWRRAPPSERQVLLAANSQGTIKVLELV
ncbi:E3 ubiquitin-protein ligase COP1-like [Choristoneura fumiferana]|uniref:E3 ubiquitin-protein ligase COP1-like n=1 Tax=Choristoneura fumiferana TaxID=7141 RepID=UPI003D153D25